MHVNVLTGTTSKSAVSNVPIRDFFVSLCTKTREQSTQSTNYNIVQELQNQNVSWLLGVKRGNVPKFLERFLSSCKSPAEIAFINIH